MKYTLCLLTAAALSLTSCKINNLQTIPSGISYEIYHGKNSPDSAIKSGDVVTMESRFTLQRKDGSDSILENTKGMNHPEKVPLSQQMRSRDIVNRTIYDVLVNMHKGDSATFLIPVDSLDKRALASMDFLKLGDRLKGDITVIDVTDSADFQKELAKKRADRHAQFEQEKPMIIQQSNKFFNGVKDKNRNQWLNDSVVISHYLKQNNLNAMSLPSGLYYIIEDPGTGKAVNMFDTISVNYKGYLTNGEVFDQSKGTPFQFIVGTQQVIPGWDQGLQLFKEGSKGKLIIPSYLAYGDRETGGIPANSVLVFDIEVVSVK